MKHSNGKKPAYSADQIRDTLASRKRRITQVELGLAQAAQKFLSDLADRVGHQAPIEPGPLTVFLRDYTGLTIVPITEVEEGTEDGASYRKSTARSVIDKTKSVEFPT